MDDPVQDQVPPEAATEQPPTPSTLNRRGFLKLSSVSSAAAVLAACANQPAVKPTATGAAAAKPTAAPTAAATAALFAAQLISSSAVRQKGRLT